MKRYRLEKGVCAFTYVGVGLQLVGDQGQVLAGVGGTVEGKRRGLRLVLVADVVVPFRVVNVPNLDSAITSAQRSAAHLYQYSTVQARQLT